MKEEISGEAKDTTENGHLQLNGGSQKARELLVAKIDQLLELERLTRPVPGEEVLPDKARRAFEALELAGEIVGTAADWAINHYIGMTLVEPKLGFHRVLAGHRDDSEYLRQRQIIDSCELELAGADARSQPFSPEQTRGLLRNLLRANPGAFPDQVQWSLIEALEALEIGQTPPLFEPPPHRRYRKTSYRQLQQQLWAYALVEYRVNSRGMKRMEAQEEVAKAYKVELNTLAKWKPNLMKELGKFAVRGLIDRAKNRGINARDTGRKPKFDGIFGDEALEKAGREYQSLRPRRQKKTRATRRAEPA